VQQVHDVSTSDARKIHSTPDHSHGEYMNSRFKALVIGAHPDDCALGAGGFCVLLRRSGWQVTFLTVTSGELGGNPNVRLQEERLCAGILGVDLDLGFQPDGKLDGPSSVRMLEEKLDQHNPDLILTHTPGDSHSDHRVLSDSVLSAARRHASVLFYEGPSTQSFTPSLKIDITTVWELKARSLAAHASQRERVRTVEWAETIGRHRAWPHYRGICEAYTPARMDLDLLCQATAAVPAAQPTRAQLASA
jgi:LmbE family N-acetylglucosaminyl deacetylase